MTGDERDRRDSRALEPELITDPQEKAAAEARNGFRQYDAAIGAIHEALERGAFKLRPSLILGLQREALAGISSYAGNYRPGGVAIEGSKHEPVGAHLVPALVEDSWVTSSSTVGWVLSGGGRQVTGIGLRTLVIHAFIRSSKRKTWVAG